MSKDQLCWQIISCSVALSCQKVARWPWWFSLLASAPGGRFQHWKRPFFRCFFDIKNLLFWMFLFMISAGGFFKIKMRHIQRPQSYCSSVFGVEGDALKKIVMSYLSLLQSKAIGLDDFVRSKHGLVFKDK